MMNVAQGGDTVFVVAPDTTSAAAMPCARPR
jgi:hypothetical protein